MQNSKIERGRPFGITIIAILLIIQGILALLLALISFFASISTPLALVGTFIASLIGLVCIVLAYGLWTLKSWAFGATVAVQILSIVFTLCNAVAMLPKNTSATVISNLVFPIIVLIYLFADKKVRSAFSS